MRIIKKYLSIYLSIFMVIICLPNHLNVFAHDGSGGAFGDDVFTYDSNLNAYTMVDDSNLPVGPLFYYKYTDGRCWTCSLSDGICLLANKALGIVLKPSDISNIVSNIQSFNGSGTVLKKNGNSTTIVGYALNDISYCRLTESTANESVSIPSNTTNEVYVIIKDYVDSIPPDYILVPTINKNIATPLLSSSDTYYNEILSYIDNPPSDFLFKTQYVQRTSNPYFWFVDESNFQGFIYSDSIKYGVSSDLVSRAVSRLNLSNQNNSFDILDCAGINLYGNVYLYDSNNLQVNNITRIRFDGSSANYGGYVSFSYDGSRTNQLIIETPFSNTFDYFTVYSSSQTPTQMTNNVYSPSYYTTETFNNYNSNADNSVTTNTTSFNNATNNNTNIYNQTQETTNNNNTENNYQINNTENYNSTTTIINNYYGDNPGGSGDDDDDDDDDSIWQALLKAIAEFFKKIGEFLAAILTGIVELFTEIIGAITNITTNMTALTDFLSSIFSWLPTEIVAVITLGFSLGVFICLIKLFK